MQNNKARLSNNHRLLSTSDFNPAPPIVHQMTDRDLLAYMGDLLLELEELAVAHKFEGLGDLLGYAHRETERNRKSQSALCKRGV